MALKLTTYNADGSIKTLGFNPLMGYYENSRRRTGRPSAGATWLKTTARARSARTPAGTRS